MPEAPEGAPAASPDRAPALAEFLLSEDGCAIRDPDALHAACVSRWPDVTAEQIRRGIAIARETLRADAAVHFAEADALDAVAVEQRRQARG